MKNRQLVQELMKRDPEGDAQIFAQDEDGSAYYDISEVNGFTNSPDTVIHVGGVRCTGP